MDRVHPAQLELQGKFEKAGAKPKFELTNKCLWKKHTNGIFQKVREILKFYLSVFELNGMHCIRISPKHCHVLTLSSLAVNIIFSKCAA